MGCNPTQGDLGWLESIVSQRDLSERGLAADGCAAALSILSFELPILAELWGGIILSRLSRLGGKLVIKLFLQSWPHSLIRGVVLFLLPGVSLPVSSVILRDLEGWE